ncbi:hypothetical protein M3_0179 [Lysinibacillus phage vB_LfM_LysYB1]|nr:hypothetical protein M3_0179 [Lysinibacillus phage vB_LfM_LysYB1]WAB25309.1 hypothetical protein M5_0131 [Lysinibacillus phage vB_LfM_LysYB2]
MGKKTIVAVSGFWLTLQNENVGEGFELVHERGLGVYGRLWETGFKHGFEAMEHIFFSREILPTEVKEVLESDYIHIIEDRINELGYNIIKADREWYEKDWMIKGLGE